jgi:hypothetical protein
VATIDHSAEIWKLIATGTRPGRELMEEVRDLIADTLIAETLIAETCDLTEARGAQKQIAGASAPAIELNLIVTDPIDRVECLSLSPLPAATAS